MLHHICNKVSFLLFHVKDTEVWIGYEGYDKNTQYVSFPADHPTDVYIPYKMQPVPCAGYLNAIKLGLARSLANGTSFNMWDILQDGRYTYEIDKGSFPCQTAYMPNL